MNLTELIAYIDANINTKTGDDKITGAIHNDVLKEVVNSLIDIISTGYGGDISPDQDPGTQHDPIFFMATVTGTYTYCGGVVVNSIPAFISWNGSAWTVHEFDVSSDPGGGGDSSLQGIIWAGTSAPVDKEVGDWYIFMGGGTLNWPGMVKDKPGVVYIDRIEDVGGTPTPMWDIVFFGGDKHLMGIASPSTDPSGGNYIADDYYLVLTAGDYSAFPGISATTVTGPGILLLGFDGDWGYTAFGGSIDEGTTVSKEDTVNNEVVLMGIENTISHLSLAETILVSSKYGSYILNINIHLDDIEVLALGVDRDPVNIPEFYIYRYYNAVGKTYTYEVKYHSPSAIDDDILKYTVLNSNVSGILEDDVIRGESFIDNPDNNREIVTIGGGGGAETEIVAPAAWDGTAYTIDLSAPKQYTLQVNDTVTAIEFALSFPADANEKSREIIVRIDNSGNTSAIETITWTGNWVWAVGDPVTGIAAGGVVELVVRNISDTVVKAYTDTE